MGNRQYSDREKADALTAVIANNGNVKKTAQQKGLPPRTLANWAKGVGYNADIRQMVEEKRLKLADELESIAYQCVGLLPHKLPKASVKEIVGAMSQAIEKSRLLQGEPTSINKEVGGPQARRETVKAWLVEQGIIVSDSVQ